MTESFVLSHDTNDRAEKFNVGDRTRAHRAKNQFLQVPEFAFLSQGGTQRAQFCLLSRAFLFGSMVAFGKPSERCTYSQIEAGLFSRFVAMFPTRSSDVCFKRAEGRYLSNKEGLSG